MEKFYQYQLTVTNRGTEEVSSWEISVSFSEDIILSDGWNGEYTEKGKKLTISYYTNEDMKIRGMIETIIFL